MYHAKLIDTAIQEYNHTAPTAPLVEYPIDQVRYYVRHFESLYEYDKKGTPVNFTRKLTPDELAFIVNERQMCSYSFIYWCERYAFIEHVLTGEMVLMKLNLAQRAALLIISQMQLQGVPIRMLFLKARQLGVSTLFQLIILHRMLFMPSTTAIVASGDEEKTRKLVEKMVEKRFQMLPWWLVRPDVTFLHSGDEFMTVRSAGSMLVVQHGRQKLGMARGDTANTYHFSELLEFSDYASLVETGFNRAIHSTARTFGVEETTASPRGADFHRYWEETERDYPQGLTMVRPVFLPYFIGRDIYPPPGEEKSMPVPDSWQVPEFVEEHAASCEEYARTSPVLSQVMPVGWKMDIGQKWWYYREYSKASADPRKLAGFLAEVPANSKEAFQSWQRSIFPIQLMMEYQRRLPQPVLPPLMFDGPDVPEVSKPILDPGEQPIHTVTFHANAGAGQRMTWKLYGLPFTNYEDELDPLHKLWVWELPTKNQKYVVSMDCGGGLGQDRTVIQVVRLGNPYQPAAQVAEYATDLANAFECWSVMLMLLQWYSPYKFDGSREYALAAIEMAADGRTAQNEIFKRGWPNIYIRQKSDQRKVTPFEQPNLGWDTNQSTRAILISWIQNFVKRHQVVINSPWVLDELRDFVMHVTRARDGSMGQIKVQAGRDAHDDRIMALAIGLVTGHELDIYRDERDPNWIAAAEHTKKQVELAGPVRSSFDVQMPDPGNMLAIIPTSEYDTAGWDELANPMY
mgnify:CR=1 FL=1